MKTATKKLSRHSAQESKIAREYAPWMVLVHRHSVVSFATEEEARSHRDLLTKKGGVLEGCSTQVLCDVSVLEKERQAHKQPAVMGCYPRTMIANKLVRSTSMHVNNETNMIEICIPATKGFIRQCLFCLRGFMFDFSVELSRVGDFRPWRKFCNCKLIDLEIMGNAGERVETVLHCKFSHIQDVRDFGPTELVGERVLTWNDVQIEGASWERAHEPCNAIYEFEYKYRSEGKENASFVIGYKNDSPSSGDLTMKKGRGIRLSIAGVSLYPDLQED